jgi:excisionase family DNA binding protein
MADRTRPGPIDAGDLVSVADAAKRLERSTEQVRRYLREGRLTGRRVGGQWFIDRTAIEAFRTAMREPQGFLEKVAPASDGGGDPLAMVIGIGRGGGSNVAEGKDAYRRAFWWRR